MYEELLKNNGKINLLDLVNDDLALLTIIRDSYGHVKPTRKSEQNSFSKTLSLFYSRLDGMNKEQLNNLDPLVVFLETVNYFIQNDKFLDESEGSDLFKNSTVEKNQNIEKKLFDIVNAAKSIDNFNFLKKEIDNLMHWARSNKCLVMEKLLTIIIYMIEDSHKTKSSERW